ncbi:MAG: hypothetical protein RL264_89, partial [Bacteroidota bacterium]
GNQISTYDHEVVNNTVQFNLKERNIFGSSRIGSKQDSMNVLNTSPKANYTLILGRKFYEFTNHLGNVLTVFSDVKIPQDTDNNNVVDNYKIGIVRTADYSPFGVALDGRTKDYEIPIVTNGTPGVIYQRKFDDSPNAHPYTGTPSNLDPNLTQVSWTNSLNAWTNYTGHTGRAIAITNTVQDTARLYLNMNVNSGYLLDVISYSFRHRSSPTGYANYNIYINNIFVGSGSIFVSSSTTLQTTGTVNVANAIAGISGTVTVRLDLYNRVGPLTQGTFRMDDFVLNGYTTALEHWSPAGYRYGFNNKEKDDEVKGSGNSYDFGARMYDSRVGQWLTIDAYFSKYPDVSPYSSYYNNPITLMDINGDSIARFGYFSGKFLGFYDDGKSTWSFQRGYYDKGGKWNTKGSGLFNDSKLAIQAIRNNSITKIEVLSDKKIQKIMINSGVYTKKAQSNPYKYVLENGVANGKMDYGIQGAESGDIEKNTLYIRNGIAYDNGDIGNYLFGYGASEVGIPGGISQIGANYNHIKNGRRGKDHTDFYDHGPGTYGKPGLLDSNADQSAIVRGAAESPANKIRLGKSEEFLNKLDIKR